ncbi:MAG: phosphomannomutase/phosphoglucomutase [Conexivisphaera sp.]
MGIFRAYDVRGIYPHELGPELAARIGMSYGAIATSRGLRAIYIGRDARLTGPVLMAAFSSGAMASGLDVVDVGLVHTPLIYWLTARDRSKEGVMITASHNPPEYNGVKISYSGKAYYYDNLYRDIESSLDGASPSTWDRAGSMSHEDHLEDYMEDVLRRSDHPENPLKAVVDSSNGSCWFARELLSRAGVEVIPVNVEPDGRFPHHVPDPLREEAYVDASRAVRSEGADLGIVFDGDCDRVGFVDELGNPIGGDAAAMVLAADVLSRRPGSKVVLNVMMSKAVSDLVSSLGGIPVMVRVGHSFVQEALEREGAAFAAEISGHFYLADSYYGFDDAAYAALRFIGALSSAGRRLSDLVRSLPRYHSSPESRFHCPDELKFRVVEELRRRYEAEGLHVIAVDGVRVEVEHGWWIVRASNTEPALVLRAEAKDPASLDALTSRMQSDLASVMRDLGCGTPQGSGK